MAPSRAVLPIVFVVAACGPRSDTPPPALPAAAPMSSPRPSPAPAAIPLVEGLKLTLVPYLHGVLSEDLPLTARRDVEILAFEKGQLRLRWTGTVRVEKPESARRREDWVRARSNAPRSATPESPVPPEYENRSVVGTLFF